ncbi:probable cytochrome P450 4d20 [Caerostris extrusa]|uniref:Probable cytochrome P450 4d20 n=1 Tax=Caerostris extrusa TaxID=172846 RepID=A0AAV4N6W7_CAEEX|nr:probable cytochrome P450 4d20 [Caerostris extrusa]
MREGSRRPKCLLDVLLKLHIEDQVLDEEEVRQEVDTFIAAGHVSIAVTVKWALFLVGLYPEVQEKIHQELDSVLGADSKGPLSVADLNELKYLECVLKESNRLYPPAGAVARKFLKTSAFVATKYPREHTLLWHLLGAQRRRRPRDCIGRVFAEMEAKILVCHILRSFSLHSLDSRDQVLPIIKLSLQSSQPARIKFRHRQQ